VVHTSKCAFEVGVCCVYVLFREFGVLIRCDACEEAIVYVFVRSEPVRSIAKFSLRLRFLRSNGGEDRRPNLEDGFHEGEWAVVCRVVWVGFVGLVYSFRVAYAPFLDV